MKKKREKKILIALNAAKACKNFLFDLTFSINM